MRCVRNCVVDGPPEAVWAALQAPETHVAIARPFLNLAPADGHARFAELLHDGPTAIRVRLFGLLPLGTRIWQISRPVHEPGSRFYALEIKSRARGIAQRRVLRLSPHASGRTNIEETLEMTGWRATLLGPFAWLAQAWRLKRLARLLRASAKAQHGGGV